MSIITTLILKEIDNSIKKIFLTVISILVIILICCVFQCKKETKIDQPKYKFNIHSQLKTGLNNESTDIFYPNDTIFLIPNNDSVNWKLLDSIVIIHKDKVHSVLTKYPFLFLPKEEGFYEIKGFSKNLSIIKKTNTIRIEPFPRIRDNIQTSDSIWTTSSLELPKNRAWWNFELKNSNNENIEQSDTIILKSDSALLVYAELTNTTLRFTLRINFSNDTNSLIKKDVDLPPQPKSNYFNFDMSNLKFYDGNSNKVVKPKKIKLKNDVGFKEIKWENGASDKNFTKAMITLSNNKRAEFMAEFECYNPINFFIDRNSNSKEYEHSLKRVCEISEPACRNCLIFKKENLSSAERTFLPLEESISAVIISKNEDVLLHKISFSLQVSKDLNKEKFLLEIKNNGDKRIVNLTDHSYKSVNSEFDEYTIELIPDNSNFILQSKLEIAIKVLDNRRVDKVNLFNKFDKDKSVSVSKFRNNSTFIGGEKIGFSAEYSHFK